jgi:hypothetical protein
MDALIKRLEKEKRKAEDKYTKANSTYFSMRSIPFDKLTLVLSAKFDQVCRDMQTYDQVIAKLAVAIQNVTYANELLKTN